MPPPDPQRTAGRRAAFGVLLVTLAVYALTSAGRFDSIDTQWRYEVSINLLDLHTSAIRDPALLNLHGHVRGADGAAYSLYGLLGSVVPMPLMAVARLVGDRGTELERFMYALTGAIFGALTAATLTLLYIDLGLSRRRAVLWSLAAAFASMLWPLSCTSLDNVIHGFFALASLRLARLAGARGSARLALAAGATGGLLFAFRDALGALLPGLALACLGPMPLADRRAALGRYLAYGFGSLVGPALFVLYNVARFGSILPTGTPDTGGTLHPPVFGNPLVGAVSLLFSPGRSVFLYSPMTLLAVLGVAALWRRERALALGVVASSATWFAAISSLTLFAGEWCWGPRYLACLLPLWAVAAPFAVRAPSHASFARAVVAAGVCVQLLAVSVEHTTFYIRHELPDYFWYYDRWFYFRHSALLERPGELIDVLRARRPPQARWFAPTIHRGEVTAGAVRGAEPRVWPTVTPLFLLYSLPRPWPFWVPRVGRAHRPVPTAPTVLALVAMGAAGAALARRASARRDDEPEA